MNQIIDEIYRTNVVQDACGNKYKLQANVDRLEGEFIFDLISADPGIRKTLEVGCGYGLSSLYICAALSAKDSAEHTIIDPLQHELFHRIGITNLERAGLHNFRFVERPSEFVLPELAQSEPGAFDMVFIDGWHTFDHVMLDLFYANRLLRTGGYIVIDDCNWSAIAKAVSYIAKYPAYLLASQSASQQTVRRVLGNVVRFVLPPAVAVHLLPRNLYDRYYIRIVYSSMVALRKMRNDERNWDWFEPF